MNPQVMIIRRYENANQNAITIEKSYRKFYSSSTNHVWAPHWAKPVCWQNNIYCSFGYRCCHRVYNIKFYISIIRVCNVHNSDVRIRLKRRHDVECNCEFMNIILRYRQTEQCEWYIQCNEKFPETIYNDCESLILHGHGRRKIFSGIPDAIVSAWLLMNKTMTVYFYHTNTYAFSCITTYLLKHDALHAKKSLSESSHSIKFQWASLRCLCHSFWCIQPDVPQINWIDMAQDILSNTSNIIKF